MPLWKVLLIVAAAGLLASSLRVLARRLSLHSARRRSGGALRTACAIGVQEGESLHVWLERGKTLPASCRRMVRVSSRQGSMLSLTLHTDGTDLAPLAEIEIGPIDRSTTNVRLVEVDLRVAEDATLAVRARVRATGEALQVRVIGGRQGPGRGVCVPAEPDGGAAS